MKTPYDDIIHLPHHVSQNHPQIKSKLPSKYPLL